MTLLRFEPSGFETEVSVGTRVVDVTDEHPRAAVPYACRAANCGTCRVRVLEGLDGLEPADEDELDTLEIFDDGPDVRLCCQLRVGGQVPRITLRVIEYE
jgi:ferredoxin